MIKYSMEFKPGTLISRLDFVRISSSFLARHSETETPKIVDIGCATGDTFGPRAINVDRMDIKRMKDMAKPHHGDIEIPNYVQADAEALPFKNKSFDVAVLSEILEHVNNPINALHEAHRVANFIVICVPNEYGWSKDKKPFETNSGHLRQFKGRDLVAMVRESGIEIIEYLDWQYAGWAYYIVIGG